MSTHNIMFSLRKNQKNIMCFNEALMCFTAHLMSIHNMIIEEK